MNDLEKRLYAIDKYFQDFETGKRVFQNNYDKAILRFLIENGLYDKIYLYFGKDKYRKHTPIKVQVQDIYELLVEQRYYHLYEKYGDRVYSLLLPYIKRKDIENEIGKKEASKDRIKSFIACVLITLIFTNGLIDTALFSIYKRNFADGLERYESDLELRETLEGYDEAIQKYAEYINGLDLTDLEIIVKVIDDMWSSIYGYSCEVDGFSNELAYNRLAIYHLGYGSCRHMADDFTARINAINPEYKAYNLAVYMERTHVNDTERNVIETSASEEDKMDIIETIIKMKNGNHMVSCITIPNTSLRLIVDPTNPSIGVLDNGNIILLTDEFLKMRICGATTLGIMSDDKSELYAYLKDYFASYFKDYDYDSLLETYGTAKQNETLECLKGLYDSSKYGIEAKDCPDEEHQKRFVLEKDEKK